MTNASEQKKTNHVLPTADPSLRLIRGKKGLEAYGITLGVTQLWEDIRAGRFPAPLRLNDNSRSLFWLKSEIDAWLESRVAARDAALSAIREKEASADKKELAEVCESST